MCEILSAAGLHDEGFFDYPWSIRDGTQATSACILIN